MKPSPTKVASRWKSASSPEMDELSDEGLIKTADGFNLREVPVANEYEEYFHKEWKRITKAAKASGYPVDDEKRIKTGWGDLWKYEAELVPKEGQEESSSRFSKALKRMGYKLRGEDGYEQWFTRSMKNPAHNPPRGKELEELRDQWWKPQDGSEDSDLFRRLVYVSPKVLSFSLQVDVPRGQTIQTGYGSAHWGYLKLQLDPRMKMRWDG